MAFSIGKAVKEIATVDNAIFGANVAGSIYGMSKPKEHSTKELRKLLAAAGIDFDLDKYMEEVALLPNHQRELKLKDYLKEALALKNWVSPNLNLDRLWGMVKSLYNFAVGNEKEEEKPEPIFKNSEDNMETMPKGARRSFLNEYQRSGFNTMFGTGFLTSTENSYQKIPYKFFDKETNESFFKSSSMGLFDDSRWLIFLETPKSSSDFGVPQPPYSGFNNYLNLDLGEESEWPAQEYEKQKQNFFSEMLKPENIPSEEKEIVDNEVIVKPDSSKIFTDLTSESQHRFTAESLGFIPCSGNFNYELESVELEEISSGPFGISIPSKVVPKRKVSFTMLNDEYNTAFNYMVAYRQAMFRDFKTVLPYKHCVSILTILIYNRQHKSLYCHRLLVIPDISDIGQKGSVGVSTSGMTYDTKWEVVGELMANEKFLLDGYDDNENVNEQLLDFSQNMNLA